MQMGYPPVLCSLHVTRIGHPSALGIGLRRLIGQSSITPNQELSINDGQRNIVSASDLFVTVTYFLAGLQRSFIEVIPPVQPPKITVSGPLGLDPSSWPGDYKYMLSYNIGIKRIDMMIMTDDAVLYDGDVKCFSGKTDPKKLKDCINCRHYEPYVDLDMNSMCMSDSVSGDRYFSSDKSPLREGGECGEERLLFQIR